MIQIIGFLGCAYLLIKGLELLGRASRYAPEIPFTENMSPEDRKTSQRDARGQEMTYVAAWSAIVAAVLFAVWLYVQGSAIPTPPYG